MTTSVNGPVMLGVSGTTLNENDQRRVEHPFTGGVILFKSNFNDRKQLVQLTQQIKQLAAKQNKRIIIAVDQEGGRVQRFKTDGFTHLPAMRQLGELWDRKEIAQTKAKEAAQAVGYLMAAELRACGVDLSLAPVIDLDYGHPSTHVIGDRAFHSDPEVMAQLAGCVIDGMKAAGMEGNCAKHFPGHGFVKGDSHHLIPTDERPFEEIKADIQPYQRLRSKLKAVMAAFVVYPTVDKNEPACFSRQWLQETLRRDLGFAAAILTDSLDMAGARAHHRSVTQAAQVALKAGCDMLVCADPTLADELLEGLKASGTQPEQASLDRLQGLLPTADHHDVLTWDTLQQQPKYRAAHDLVTKLFVSQVFC